MAFHACRSRSFASLAIAVQLLLSTSPARAQWDGSASGRIRMFEITHVNNYGFRVRLQGDLPLCNAGHTWAYVDAANSNYKVFVATLLAAKASGSTVALYTVHDSSGHNHCRIEHVSVSD